jgi:hypothetical protein
MAIGSIYGNLVYFVAIWYILWLFGIFHGYLVYIFPCLATLILFPNTDPEDGSYYLLQNNFNLGSRYALLA